VAVDFITDGVCDVLLKLRDSQSKSTRPFMPYWKKKISAECYCFCWGWAFFWWYDTHCRRLCSEVCFIFISQGRL